MAASTNINRACFQFNFTNPYTIIRSLLIATSNSRGAKPRPERHLRNLRPAFAATGRLGALFAGLVVLLGSFNARAQVDTKDPKPPGAAEFAAQAEKTYDAARTRYSNETNNLELAWRFARACFDWADYATTDAKRAAIAGEGIAACHKLLETSSNSIPGHYYLAMNLGQLARTKSLGALKIVGQMEVEFKTGLRLDSGFDYAGPDRNLGLLYLDTPGWPVSLGGKSKARQHLQQALKLSPGYPDNHLNLIEAQLKWGDKKAAIAGLKALDEIWPEAREKLTGDEWAPDWADWTKRREAAQKKAGAAVTPPPAGK
jgi:Tetratricopeptide repeat